MSDYFVYSQHSWEWNNCTCCDIAVRSQFLPMPWETLSRGVQLGSLLPMAALLPLPLQSVPCLLTCSRLEIVNTSSLNHLLPLWTEEFHIPFLLSNRWWIPVCHSLLLDHFLFSHSGFKLFCFSLSQPFFYCLSLLRLAFSLPLWRSCWAAVQHWPFLGQDGPDIWHYK